jgi:hypothetical protein
VAVIPYVKKNGIVKILSERMPFEKTNKFNVPISNISYDDIPKVMNKH